MLALMRMLSKVPPLPPTFTTAAQLDRPATVCSGFIAICLGLMKVPCSAPVCLLSSAGREEEERGGREGEIWLHFSSPFLCVQVQGNTCLHFTPGKRTRGPEKERKKEEEGGKKTGWDRYLEEEEELEGFFRRRKEKWRRKEVDCCLDGRARKAVTHSLAFLDWQINTPKQKAKKRIQEWRVNCFTRRPQSWDALDAEPLHFCFVCFHLKNWTMRRLYFTDLYATRLTSLSLHYSP